jgi:hypothetical protein
MVVSKKFPLLPEKFTPSSIYDHPLRKFNKYQIPIVHPSEFRVPCAKTPPGQSSHQESDKKILADQLKALGHWKHWVYMTDGNGELCKDGYKRCVSSFMLTKGNQPNIIKLDNVTLEELGDRPSTDGNFHEAARKMEAMMEKLRTGEMQAREQSCCVIDKNGIPLLYLFSHGTDRGKKKCHGLSVSRVGKTNRIFADKVSTQGKVLDDFQAEFQHFASRYPPTLPKSDKRHQEIPWMEYLKELMDEADE